MVVNYILKIIRWWQSCGENCLTVHDTGEVLDPNKPQNALEVGDKIRHRII